MGAQSNSVRILTFLVFAPIAAISMWHFLYTGERYLPVITIPLAVWLIFGIKYAESETPNLPIKLKYLVSFGWLIHHYNARKSDADEFFVYLNDVKIGSVSRNVLNTFKIDSIKSLDNLTEQLQRLIFSFALSVQLIVAYTGGVVIWIIFLGYTFQRIKLLSVVDMVMNNNDERYAIAIIKIFALVAATNAIRIAGNVYSLDIERKIRILLSQPSLGKMTIVKNV